ncbi:hypothetical protein SERLA73DRAFT_61215 [Serpula lacrymans var. lacrymans S7.3]|uniref:Uncharacterized protein n=2 Tax=Serpula lacrymans var. lacrymans TaxID=341189 RepID=F8Q914_SERL3|nr:hypothetical protein SERLA73DRAFT_61215 [Serpula lacrymans var. lacrymans S7.3]
MDALVSDVIPSLHIHINNVSWPALYNPAIELGRVASSGPVQPGGSYLTNANDIFHFTLYWTLVFHIPSYLVCGVYAFLNFAFPPTPLEHHSFPLVKQPSNVSQPADHFSSHKHLPQSAATYPYSRIKPSRMNTRRSRLTFAILVLLTFFFVSLLGTILSSAIVGYILAAVYRSGKFSMST